MDGSLGGRDYDHELGELEYEDEYWRGMERQERMYNAPARMTYHQSYPVMQRPMMTNVRMSPAGGIRKIPLIIRKANSRVHYATQVSHQHLPAVRPVVHQMRMHKMHQGIDDSRSMMERESSSHEMPYHVPYANEETVRTSEEQHVEEEEEEETEMHDHSIKRLEDELEMDEEGASEGPSTSMPKMIVRPKGMPPIFHPADNKALIENHQLKTKLAALMDSHSRYRDEVLQLRDEKRELLKQFRKQEKVIEKQSVELAEAENQLAELRRREKEKDKKYERELAMKDKRRKTITVMPCLPNRKVVFSKATKQAQSLRLRLLHRYLGELCGPVEGEHRLEEKNLIVLRWRKAHAPKPSLEIGRQLLPSEEDEFCRRFGIVGERKKEIKKWLGQKHIDLFGPSERALAVRKWRMGQREKKRRGEKAEKMMNVEEEILDEAGNDTDDDELMDDIERALEEESGVGEREEEAQIMDDEEEDEQLVVVNR
ncbi:hypothetical protein PMAYCL1PPCAC_18501 [Pristionchus mayeri]|uniref:Uncharacterized protein n=1 Tax=Pristionchus mayeri TaxID=1317129 RepID=A0AAN5CPI2_9BILA|nr:hypothetical protein PMAYCL1PPCAC_18501 [Pristionchus mayeri]